MTANRVTRIDELVAAQVRIEAARESITQRKLADLSGIHVNTLSRIWRGERSATLGELSQILGALGVDRETFFANVARAEAAS